jgi:hypothetical protein
MSRVYEALKQVVQERLQRSKANPIRTAQVKESDPASLDNRMEELHEIVADWIDTLKPMLKERETALSGELHNAEQVIESLRVNITALEAMVTNTEEIVHAKEVALKELQQQIDAKTQELENHTKKNGELLAEREKQVNELKSKLKLVKNGIKESSSFFRQAEEALSTVDAEEPGTPFPSDEWTRREDKPVGVEVNGGAGTSNALDGSQEIVPQKFFDRMTVALTHVLGRKAAKVVRDHVEALGESTERFPKARVTELIEAVSREIPDENMKIGFREVLGESL